MGNLNDLNERARMVFRHIVENYLEHGDPIGSKFLAETMSQRLSPASIRATMADLESLGLLYSPHISAGRLPTEQGLRLFVDGLLQVGELSEAERLEILPQLAERPQHGNLTDLVTRAVESLTGLSSCASLVVVPNQTETVKHIEFIPVSDEQLLVVMVDARDRVENRLIKRPKGITPAHLVMASNYLNARLKGRSIHEVRQSTLDEIRRAEAELDILSAQVIETGLADWAAAPGDNHAPQEKSLIVRGQSNLLNNIETDDLERIRILLEDLERKKDLIELLANAEEGDSVRIFIGAETKLFSLSGSSLIVRGYRDKDRQIVGVLGIIAPTRSNYARLIPLVDHTARLVTYSLERTEPGHVHTS